MRKLNMKVIEFINEYNPDVWEKKDAKFIIRHGNYYSVYSNLSAVYVTAGTKVSMRQSLGTVASDGTGHSMLHFQLRRNTEKLNPLSWIRH